MLRRQIKARTLNRKTTKITQKLRTSSTELKNEEQTSRSWSNWWELTVHAHRSRSCWPGSPRFIVSLASRRWLSTSAVWRRCLNFSRFTVQSPMMERTRSRPKKSKLLLVTLALASHVRVAISSTTIGQPYRRSLLPSTSRWTAKRQSSSTLVLSFRMPWHITQVFSLTSRSNTSRNVRVTGCLPTEAASRITSPTSNGLKCRSMSLQASQWLSIAALSLNRSTSWSLKTSCESSRAP